jgi:hypothetical protein
VGAVGPAFMAGRLVQYLSVLPKLPVLPVNNCETLEYRCFSMKSAAESRIFRAWFIVANKTIFRWIHAITRHNY